MHDRYSVYVDDAYSFSLSESALIESGIHSGLELTNSEVATYIKLSTDDKLYTRALRYVAMRQKSEWELLFYLERKGADPSLSHSILNKLSNIGLIDDEKYAQSYVNNRLLLRPTSRRKIIMELKKKRIASAVIDQVFSDQDGQETPSEQATLASVIERKRRQTKYQDDQKLMQYLARQGYNYGDIKSALRQDAEEY